MNQHELYGLFKLIIERNRLARQRHNYHSQVSKLHKQQETAWIVSYKGDYEGATFTPELIRKHRKDAVAFIEKRYPDAKKVDRGYGSVTRVFTSNEKQTGVVVKLERTNCDMKDTAIETQLIRKTFKLNAALDELCTFTKNTSKLRKKYQRELGTMQCTDDRGVIQSIWVGLKSVRDYEDIYEAYKALRGVKYWDEKWDPLHDKFSMACYKNGVMPCGKSMLMHQESREYKEKDMLQFIMEYEAEQTLLGE